VLQRERRLQPRSSVLINALLLATFITGLTLLLFMVVGLGTWVMAPRAKVLAAVIAPPPQRAAPVPRGPAPRRPSTELVAASPARPVLSAPPVPPVLSAPPVPPVRIAPPAQPVRIAPLAPPVRLVVNRLPPPVPAHLAPRRPAPPPLPRSRSPRGSVVPSSKPDETAPPFMHDDYTVVEDATGTDLPPWQLPRRARNAS
jgi:hypothetical protein